MVSHYRHARPSVCVCVCALHFIGLFRLNAKESKKNTASERNVVREERRKGRKERKKKDKANVFPNISHTLHTPTTTTTCTRTFL